MLVRLGRALSWACYGIAALVVLFHIFEFLTSSLSSADWLQLTGIRAVLAAGLVLIGRAVRYVLANE